MRRKDAAGSVDAAVGGPEPERATRPSPPSAAEGGRAAAGALRRPRRVVPSGPRLLTEWLGPRKKVALM